MWEVGTQQSLMPLGIQDNGLEELTQESLLYSMKTHHKHVILKLEKAFKISWRAC